MNRVSTFTLSPSKVHGPVRILLVPMLRDNPAVEHPAAVIVDDGYAFGSSAGALIMPATLPRAMSMWNPLCLKVSLVRQTKEAMVKRGASCRL